MQNTARGQAHPNTLIKNFFIVGVRQKLLMDILFENGNLLTNIPALDPEILFSMYSSNEDMMQCLSHCFPQKIQVNFSMELSVPKFFTFVQMNESLEQQYYHTFIYYEQINKTRIYDFDYNKDKAKKALQEKMTRKKRAVKARMSQSVAGSRASSTLDDDGEDESLAFDDTMDMKDQMRMAAAAELQAKNKAIMQQREKEKELLAVDRGSKRAQKGNLMNSGRLEKINEDAIEDEPRVMNTASMISAQNDQQSSSEMRAQEQSDSHNDSSIQEADEVDDVQMYIPIAFVIQTEVEYHDIFRELSLDLFESIRKTPENPKNKNGEEIKINFQDRRKMAFADFIAKIAFLKTVPCPSFNTKFNIELHQKTLVIEEGQFNRIPNNNDIAMQLLFQIMDVKAIFFVWKALLFDYSVVLISNQYSLQFNIAEALKQLMFPLTWQNSYVQPANKEKIELVESPAPVFLCACDEDFRDTGLSAFEYLEQLRLSRLVPNLVICDIDGGITNENAPIPSPDGDPLKEKKLKFPEVNMEAFLQKNLNILHKQQYQTFDQAYPDHKKTQQEREFVMDVRKLFFNILKPILAPLTEKDPNNPNKMMYFKGVDGSDVSTVFDKYFEREDYNYLFEDDENISAFVKMLISGSPFQHFCDDYFEEEINNFKLFTSILTSNEQDEACDDDKFQPQTPLSAHTSEVHLKRGLTGGTSIRRAFVKFVKEENNPILQRINREIGFIGAENLKEQEKWPGYPSVVIDWKMPQDCQRVMIFERLEYILNNMCKSSQSDVKEKDAQAFKPLIAKIKDLYKSYLPQYREQVESLLQVGNALSHEEHKDEAPVDISVGEQGQDDDHSPKSKSSNSRSQMSDKSPLLNKVSQSNLLFQSAISSHKTDDRDEKIQKELEQNKQKIVRMTYGSQGLISFLDDLFFLLIGKDMLPSAVKEMKEDAFNFFFLVKDMFNRLDNYQKSDNGQINETGDHIFNQTPEERALIERQHEESLKINFNQKDREQIVKTNKVQNGAQTWFYYIDDTKCKESECLGLRECKYPNVHEKVYKVYPERHAAPNMWMMPRGWYDCYARLKTSPQYLMMKIKLTSKFEDNVDASENAFYQMLKWPINQVNIFPRMRLNYFMAEVPMAQKRIVVDLMRQIQEKYGIIQVETCLKFFDQQIELEKQEEMRDLTLGSDKKKRNVKIYTLKDKIFCKADIVQVFAERERELEIQRQAQQRAMEEAKRKSENAIPRQSIANVSSDIKQRIQRDKTEKEQRSGFFGFFRDKDKEKEKEKEKQKEMEKKTQLAKSKTVTSSQGQPAGQNLTIDASAKKISMSASTPGINTSGSQSPNSIARSSLEESKSPVTPAAQFGINQSVCSTDFAESELMSRQLSIQRDIQPQDDFEINYSGDKFAQKLLQRMINFFNDHYGEFSKMDHKEVKAEYKESRLKELMEIKKKAKKMYGRKFVFNQYTKNVEEFETIKQCFWLNILNFMTLFKLAEIKLTYPNPLRQLKLFPTWQAFMLYNSIDITGIRITQQQIYHKVIRHHLALPGITMLTQGILSDPSLEINDLNIQAMFVEQPNKFISYGFFLPVKNMPMLQVYKKETLDQQLKWQVQVVNSGQMSVSPGNFLVTLPKWMKWYYRDFAEMEEVGEQQSNLDLARSSEQSQGRKQKADVNELSNRNLLQILEVLCSNHVMSNDEKESDALRQVLASIKNEMTKGKRVHQFEFYKFKWDFDPEFLKMNIDKNAVAKKPE